MDNKSDQTEKEGEKKPRRSAESSASSNASFFTRFEDSFFKEKQIEDKIAHAIAFMREVLSKSDKMNLKSFWDAKKLCAPLFKEPMHPIKRNHLWSEYSELIKEAVRLKEFFDEQVTFAVEQIELAVTSLESDFASYDQLVEKTELPAFSSALQKIGVKKTPYEKWQRELKVLKALIARLDALRGETLSQDMRISQKNRLLKRLSKLGDHFFPKRKSVIKEASDQFIQDVEAFSGGLLSQGDQEKENAAEKKRSQSFYALREGIKDFQALAKVLTLTSSAFSKSRACLSQCWDWIKEKDKERKQELGKRSQEHKENFTELKDKISGFKKLCRDDQKIAKEKIVSEGSKLISEIKKAELSREGKATLRFELDEIQNAALSKIEEAIAAAAQVEKDKLQQLKETVAQVMKQEKELSLEALEEKEVELLKAFEDLKLTPVERHLFERQFSDLRSFILDKKVLSDLSNEKLRQIFEQREQLQEEIRGQIETYRLEMGGSCLDFEQAMTYRELYDSAKIHLDREVEALDELREKLGSQNL